MTRIVSKLPYFNKRIGNQPTKGQSLVEFALVSVLLFTLMFGIIEMGRFMFIFSQVASASQEGTRYAVSHPREIIRSVSNAPVNGQCPYPCGLVENGGSESDDPCNIIYQARSKVTLIQGDPDVQVEVGYDDGNGNTVNPFPLNASPSFSSGSVRVVVTATYQFRFLLGLFDRFWPQGMDVRMVSARTIPNDPDYSDTRLRCDYDAFNGPTPTPLPCQTVSINRVGTQILINKKAFKFSPVFHYRIYDPYGNQITNASSVVVKLYTDNSYSILAKTVTLTYSSAAGYWNASTNCTVTTNALPNNDTGIVYTQVVVSGTYSTIPYPNCSVTPNAVLNDTASLAADNGTYACP
jgi:hypothetical protein